MRRDGWEVVVTLFWFLCFALCVLVFFLMLVGAVRADPTRIYGTDTVRFWWEAATGPVDHYEAKLSYADGTESQSVVGFPPQCFTPRKGIPFRLVVRACDAEGRCSDWSTPSDETRICPLEADIDCNLSVGMSDFGILVKTWGEVHEP